MINSQHDNLLRTSKPIVKPKSTHPHVVACCADQSSTVSSRWSQSRQGAHHLLSPVVMRCSSHWDVAASICGSTRGQKDEHMLTWDLCACRKSVWWCVVMKVKSSPHKSTLCICVCTCLSESLKWLLCQQQGNLKMTHTYVWIFLCVFVFPPLFLQPTPYRGTGGPTWWDPLEATALTMPSRARPLSLSASSKACEFLCMCVFLHTQTWAAPFNQSYLPLIHLSPLLLPPNALFIPLSTFCCLLNSSSCCLLIFMCFFSQITSLTSISPLHVPCVPSSVASIPPHPSHSCYTSSPPSPPLQSNSQSVVAEEGRRAVWISDR